MGKPAATVDSTAMYSSSQTVKINGKVAARNGYMVMTCNDPSDLPVGIVIATGTVYIG